MQKSKFEMTNDIYTFQKSFNYLKTRHLPKNLLIRNSLRIPKYIKIKKITQKPKTYISLIWFFQNLTISRKLALILKNVFLRILWKSRIYWEIMRKLKFNTLENDLSFQ